jgi:hypothetical protein
MTERRKPSALMSLALLAGMVAALLAAWSYRDNPMTRGAQDYAESIAATSAATYVTLRTLNALLSTAQEVEVGGSFFVSGNAQPFKWLEPIDDTVERVAGVIFAIMIATGVLAVALGPLGAAGYSMIAVALLVWLLGRLFDSRPLAAALGRWLAWYGAFLALAVPLAFVVAAAVADRLTDAAWDRHSATVAEITADIENEAPVDGSGPAGAVGGSLRKIEQYQELATNVWSRADELIQGLVGLLAVYIFKLFVLPLMILGAFFVVARSLARSRAA